MLKTIKEIQSALNLRGFGPLVETGTTSPAYIVSVKKFQASVGLQADGDAGPLTIAELFPRVIVREKPRSQWPLQKDCIAFYGAPGNPRCTAGRVTPKAHLFYDKSVVRSFQCHELVAPSMQRIFDRTIDHYGEKEWRRLGLDRFSGCFNVRPMRGGTAWSMHSWGIAVDLDASRNTLHQTAATAEFAKPAYVPFWNIVESEGAISLGRARGYDFMHLQFARLS